MSYPAQCMNDFRRDQRGQLTVLFALGLFTLLLFLTLTVNIGQAAVRRHQVQFIADMGALTGSSVQARGLNLMTRLNALSLRTFNVFSVRSRVSGYRNHRVPLLSTALRLIPAKLPNVTLWTGDEEDAFKNMHQIFNALRVSMKAANYYYEVEARQAAYDVTERNVKTLVGSDNWTELNQEGLIARPVMAVLPGLNFDNLFSLGGLMEMINMVKGMSGSMNGAVAGLTGIRPLVPEFADPDGDLVIMRYWTDLSTAERITWAALYAAAVCAPTAVTVIGYAICVAKWTKDFSDWIEYEDKLRWIDGPAWHEFRPTLHRKDGEENDTHFLFWARLPTTSAAMGSLVFADMPSMVAFSAARPVGGSFGTKPKQEALGSNIPGVGSILGIIGNVALPPTEHLNDSYKYRMESPGQVHDNLGWLPNLYWYKAWHLPEYQPRLVPIERRYLTLTGHHDLENDRERLNLPEDYWEQIDRMIQMYRQ
jgi:hypothetical protein